MDSILKNLELFCEQEIIPFLKNHEGDIPYPKEILKKMGSMGVFGLNIPKEYGGEKLPIALNLKINQLLSKYWLSIPALLGTHLRANQYFVELATDKQKEEYLPKMATGELIVAHAFHEKAIKNPLEFNTTIEKINDKYILSGEKEWVTNATDCNRMLVVARRKDSSSCSAVIINKNMVGVHLEKDHYRVGLDGISLQKVIFRDVVLEEYDFIGGSSICALSFVNRFRAASSLNFASRCVGVSESIVDLVRPYLLIEKRDKYAKGVIYYKWSELVMVNEAIGAYFDRSVSLNTENKLSKAKAYRTKVFCSKELQNVVSLAKMLVGGSGFSSNNYQLIRQLNDASSLALIDTPNDTLLTWSGKEELGEE